MWNTFLGSTNSDSGNCIDVDQSGNVYVSGMSGATWGSPVNPHAGDADAFVAQLDGSGNLSWNTFLGSTNSEYGYGIDVDQSGNVYVSGNSGATWGSPVNPHASDGKNDAFVALLNNESTLVTLSSLEVVPANGEVVIKWSTDTEIDNAGFNIYRSEGGGEYEQINDGLIPAEGSPTAGATYEFIDGDVQNRTEYSYKLEDIDLNGTATQHGAVSATPRLIHGIGK
ncbi:SBBP repeat-containing protein [Thermodesulfobacteriota bacterium]